MESTNKDLEDNKLFKLHHIGFATLSVKDSLKNFSHLLFSKKIFLEYKDLEQKVNVQFFKLTKDIFIEFVVPLNLESPVNKFLEKNPMGGWHHMAYEVEDYEKEINSMKKSGFRRITNTSKGFEKRKISFFLPIDNLQSPLIEIISKPNKA